MKVSHLMMLAASVILCAPGTGAEFTLERGDALRTVWLDFFKTQNLTHLHPLAPSITDWDAEARRFGRTIAPENRAALERDCAANLRHLTRTGEQLLDVGKRLGIFASGARWTFKEGTADSRRLSFDPRVHDKDELMPSVPVMRLSFVRQGADTPDSALNGEYVVELQFAKQFPGGWRVMNGVNWRAFPPGVGGAELQADMAFAAKLAPHGETVTAADDPALKILGERVTTFLSKKNAGYFAAELIYPIDLMLQVAQERAPDRPLPPRAEVEKIFGPHQEKIVASAEAILAQAHKLGLDLANAKVKEIVADDTRAQASSGLVEMFRADEIMITLSIPAGPAGAKASAECVLASAPGERVAGRWYLQELRWVRFPPGLVPAGELARMEFENYVTKNRRLPPGTPAPGIRMLSFDDAPPVDLAKFRGKFVVLEWWATWCGPCQGPMARLQKIRDTRPDWGKDVELVTISIDDKREDAREHLQSRGWTNSVNFWAGGGWSSDPAKAFRVSAIPTLYIIAPDGKIAHSHTGTSSWEHRLDELLQAHRAAPKE